MSGMRIHIASDHAGFELKAAMVDHFTLAGHDVVDHGALEYDKNDDYPPMCLDAAEAVVADPGSLGIVIGGSGNGEQIAANKVKGARCGLGWNLETARLTRQHNDANVLGIGGRMHTVGEAISIADAFIAEPFSHDPRHQRRIDMLTAYENRD